MPRRRPAESRARPGRQHGRSPCRLPRRPPTAAQARSPTRPGWAWWLGAAVLVAAAILIATTHSHELSGAARLLTRVSPPKLAVALAAEAASLVCFAAVQRWLLHAGGVSLSLTSMTAPRLRPRPPDRSLEGVRRHGMHGPADSSPSRGGGPL